MNIERKPKRTEADWVVILDFCDFMMELLRKQDTDALKMMMGGHGWRGYTLDIPKGSRGGTNG